MECRARARSSRMSMSSEYIHGTESPEASFCRATSYPVRRPGAIERTSTASDRGLEFDWSQAATKVGGESQFARVYFRSLARFPVLAILRAPCGSPVREPFVFNAWQTSLAVRRANIADPGELRTGNSNPAQMAPFSYQNHQNRRVCAFPCSPLFAESKEHSSLGTSPPF